jgi:hypothetical protein
MSGLPTVAELRDHVAFLRAVHTASVDLSVPSIPVVHATPRYSKCPWPEEWFFGAALMSARKAPLYFALICSSVCHLPCSKPTHTHHAVVSKRSADCWLPLHSRPALHRYNDGPALRTGATKYVRAAHHPHWSHPLLSHPTKTSLVRHRHSCPLLHIHWPALATLAKAGQAYASTLHDGLALTVLLTNAHTA